MNSGDKQKILDSLEKDFPADKERLADLFLKYREQLNGLENLSKAKLEELCDYVREYAYYHAVIEGIMEAENLDTDMIWAICDEGFLMQKRCLNIENELDEIFNKKENQ